MKKIFALSLLVAFVALSVCGCSPKDPHSCIVSFPDRTDTSANTTDSSPDTTDTSVEDTFPEIPFEGSVYGWVPSENYQVSVPAGFTVSGCNSSDGSPLQSVDSAALKELFSATLPRVFSLCYSNEECEGYTALEGKQKVSLPFNDEKVALSYYKTERTFMKDSKNEMLRRLGLVDRYIGTREEKSVLVDIVRDTGLVSSLFISLNWNDPVLVGDLTFTDGEALAKDAISALYGDAFLKKLTFRSSGSGTTTGFGNHELYSYRFTRMFGDYETEEEVYVYVTKGGFVFAVESRGLGYFDDIELVLTADRLKNAADKVDALFEHSSSPRIVRGSDGVFYYEFSSGDHDYWLAIP